MIVLDKELTNFCAFLLLALSDGPCWNSRLCMSNSCHGVTMRITKLQCLQALHMPKARKTSCLCALVKELGHLWIVSPKKTGVYNFAEKPIDCVDSAPCFMSQLKLGEHWYLSASRFLLKMQSTESSCPSSTIKTTMETFWDDKPRETPFFPLTIKHSSEH